MLAEVRRSDFLPIRSFAGHCRLFVWLDFPIMRSYEAPGTSSGSISDRCGEFSTGRPDCSGWRLSAEVLL